MHRSDATRVRTAAGKHDGRHRVAACLLCLGWLLGSGAAGAGERTEAAPSLREVVERVQATCSQVQDLTARFQQTATNRTLGQVQEASGLFFLKRPGKMRWEYQKPEPRLFVTDGKTLWVYSPADKQAVAQELTEALPSRLPLGFLAGDCQLSREFELSSVEHAGTRAAAGVKLLDLKPKKPEAGIARLLLEINLTHYTVEKTTLFDAYGNTTVIALSNLKLNPGVNDQQFQFTPPAGVTVLTPSKP
jgi:outer membrane lipoprotein carrier protein